MAVSARNAAVIVVGIAVIAVIVALVVSMSAKRRGGMKKKRSAASPQRKAAARSPAPRTLSRAGAAPNGEQQQQVPRLHSSGASLSAPHPEPLVSGATANSEQPMPAEGEVRGMLSRASQGEGPQTDAKLAARAAMNLSDGKGITFPPEALQGVESAADLEALIRADPRLAAEYEAALERASQRVDASGVNRARLSRDDAQAMAAVTSDLSVPQQGTFAGRSGAPSAVSPDRFASAVGDSNLAQLAASRAQYDSLISKTLVAPDDRLRQAALAAMVHRVTDPAQRARLMSKISALSSAVFSDAEAAQQAIRDGGTGYIGFTQQRPARGNTGSLGARYSFGDGGDLAPIIFNYAPPANVSRERIQACGFATHQAYEYAAGREAGMNQ